MNSELIMPCEEFARHIHRTPQIVRRWAKRGMPTMPPKTGRGEVIVPVERAKEWILANIKLRPSVTPIDMEEEPPIESAIMDEEEGDFDEMPLNDAALEKLHTSTLYKMHMAEKIRQQRLDRQKAEGLLLDRGETELMLSRALRGFARYLHRIGRNTALECAASLRLNNEQRDVLARAIQDQIDRACGSIDVGVLSDSRVEGDDDGPE